MASLPWRSLYLAALIPKPVGNAMRLQGLETLEVQHALRVALARCIALKDCTHVRHACLKDLLHSQHGRPVNCLQWDLQHQLAQCTKQSICFSNDKGGACIPV